LRIGTLEKRQANVVALNEDALQVEPRGQHGVDSEIRPEAAEMSDEVEPPAGDAERRRSARAGSGAEVSDGKGRLRAPLGDPELDAERGLLDREEEGAAERRQQLRVAVGVRSVPGNEVRKQVGELGAADLRDERQGEPASPNESWFHASVPLFSE
jgi:hypothetical protein